MPIVVGDGLNAAAAGRVLAQIDAVDWPSLSHAYGSAGNTAGQLVAVTVGDATTRKVAWWKLWGNIWHQGTVYEATVPVVPILASLAGSPGYPDRAMVLTLLREIAAGEGSRKADVDAALAEHLPPLLAGWRDEPEPVRRALVWLVGAVPGAAGRARAPYRAECG